MCGRFVSASPPDQIARYFSATAAEALLAESYNVAPTNDVYAVVDHPDGSRHLEVFHWGLVPSWAKDIKTGLKMINARADTLATKPAYRHAFRTKRCIIPMDGFYEWKTVPGQLNAKGKPVKQPMFIHRRDGEPLAVAGLWESWRDPQNPDGPRLHSCTVVTTDANTMMAGVHDRMPAILAPAAWRDWLDPAGHDLVSLGKLLVPAPDSLLAMHPVSTAVNNVRSKGPELIEQVDPVPR